MKSILLFWGLCILSSKVISQPLTQLDLPPRPAGSMTGTQFKDSILNLALTAREEAIFAEITKGNIPNFMRVLQPVTITATIASVNHSGTIYVLPDYMAIGTDADHFFIPMTPILAQRVADAAQSILPTRKMVNSIATAATCKIAPSPISPGPTMITVPVFWDHNVTVRGQRAGNAAPQGALVRGTKKDVVISPRLVTFNDFDRVAIYGWHQLNELPIQPLYFGHESTYADYSHGIRLIGQKMLLDGATVTVADVLTSATMGPLLNDEATPFTTEAPPRYDVPLVVSDFPYSDSFPSVGREISSWIDRFQTPVVGGFVPTSPGGDGFVLTVKDTSGGIDTTRLGKSTDADYSIECDIYCELRTSLTPDGFERVGIFVRDDGNGLFCGQNAAGTIKGNNFALTWDSSTGRVQCLNTVNGVPTDLLPVPVFQPSTQWRTFRIETMGPSLTFLINGNTLLSATNSAHPIGQFGIGYQDQFLTNANIKGTRADNFLAARVAQSGVTDWTHY